MVLMQLCRHLVNRYEIMTAKEKQHRPNGWYTLATKSKGRSTFGREISSTFDKVDRVEHVQLWR